jgi:superfamily II helicase
MIQSFEIWCDYCLKTKYYDDLKAIEDDSFIKLNDSILCKSCAENNKIED